MGMEWGGGVENKGKRGARNDADSVRTRSTLIEVAYPLQSIHPLLYFLLFSKPPKIAIEFNPDPNSLFRKDPIPPFVSPTPNCCQDEQRKSS